MQLKLNNLSPNVAAWETMAQFAQPLDQATKLYLQEEGFPDARTRAVGCMGWIWSQWLVGTNSAAIHEKVESFVERGMRMQDATSKFYMRPLHDLFLLHCAIFASGDAQLMALANRVVDSSGYDHCVPRNDGELFASAWSGMLKMWIKGDELGASREAEVIVKSHRDPSFRAARKDLFSPWLKRDWKAFRANQRKDFERLWHRVRRDGTMTSQDREVTTINMEMMASVQQLWCWSHSGLALLARREGADIETDSFWLPPNAIKCVEAVI